MLVLCKGMMVTSRLKKVAALLVRILFPTALLAIHEKGIRKKLKALIRHELQMHATPGKLSCSLSLGVCMAIMPIHGFQVLLLLLMTIFFRLNRPVAMVGVSISSAPFLPFWIAAALAVGRVVTPDWLVEISTAVINEKLPVFLLSWIEHLPLPGMVDGVLLWFFGSIVLAGICGITTLAISYLLIRNLVKNDKKTCPQRSSTLSSIP